MPSAAAIRPRRLLTAYALWLCFPLVWPGAYLFYLGRDTQAWLYSVSCGGFGVGWLVDALYIPLYVADYNEPPGFHERLERRPSFFGSLCNRFNSLVMAPMTLTVQLFIALEFGAIAAYLVPRPLVLPEPLPRLDKPTSTAVGFCVGMLAIAVVIKLTAVCIGRTRCVTSWRPVLACCGLGSAGLVHMANEDEDMQHMPGFIIGSAVVMCGAAYGRRAALARSPRRCASRRLSLRLIVQGVGVGAVAAAALGSFYLNGSITTTAERTGKPVTYTGPEALKYAWKELGEFSSHASAFGQQIHAQYSRKTWAEVWESLRALVRDPAVEAAKVLGVPHDASPDAIKKAHR